MQQADVFFCRVQTARQSGIGCRMPFVCIDSHFISADDCTPADRCSVLLAGRFAVAVDV